MDHQAVPRGVLERLHRGKVVAGQLRLVLEQEPAGPGGPVVGVIGHRAGVVDEPDQPGGVGVVGAVEHRIARVQRPDRRHVAGHRRIQDEVFGPVLAHRHDPRLPGVRVDADCAHVGAGVFGEHLDRPCRHPDADQP